MSISNTLKSKMIAEQRIAILLDKTVKQLKNSALESAQNIYQGVERAAWHSSCMFDEYRNVCRELKNEDKRMILTVFEVYKRKDIILDIINIYIGYHMEECQADPQKLFEKIATIDKYLALTISHYAVHKATTVTLSYAIAKIITESISFSDKIVKGIDRSSLYVVSILSFYGKVQKATASARRLKMQKPKLHAALYAQNVELLYFLFESEIDKAEDKASYLHGEDKIIAIIKGLLT